MKRTPAGLLGNRSNSLLATRFLRSSMARFKASFLQEFHEQLNINTQTKRSINSCNIFMSQGETEPYIVWHPVAVMNNGDAMAPRSEQEKDSMEASKREALTPNFVSSDVTNSEGVGPSFFLDLAVMARELTSSSRASPSATCSFGLCTGNWLTSK